MQCKPNNQTHPTLLGLDNACNQITKEWLDPSQDTSRLGKTKHNYTNIHMCVFT